METILASKLNADVKNSTGAMSASASASDGPWSPVGCPDRQRKWYLFVSTGVVAFLIGLTPMLLVILYNRASAHFGSRRTSVPASDKDLSRTVGQTRLERLQQYLERVISGQNTIGQTLTIAILILSSASFMLYNVEASRWNFHIERCIDHWSDETLLRLDLFFNLIFLVHFMLRFLAARNKLLFWLEAFSIVDFLTIPPIFAEYSLHRTWSGLRFLRIAYLANLPDVLQIINVLRTGQLIRLSKVFTKFLVMWLICAGFVHLVESYGDVWRDDWNGRVTTYWECFYFLIVTSSTVGYGDFTCHTVVGRAFCVVFIFVALSTFANALPEFYAIANLRKPYGGRFLLPKGKKHVIVCGYITVHSATAFLNDFFHPDRKIDDVVVVFLNQEMPNLEMESLLKRHAAEAQYFCGDEMVASDLDRVDVKRADTCLILVDKLAADPDAEDAGNIMRVISLKNYCASTRIIVQLLLYQNKAYLLNIPGWSAEQHFDDAVCLSELKLGFLAQNCLAPGFSTLLSLLFMPVSSAEADCEDQLRLAYLRGAGMEVYGEMLSDDFIGTTFADTAELLYRKLNLVLFALNRVDEPYENVIINPGKSFVIPKRTQGFFIAESAEHAAKAFMYCRRCHSNVGDLSLVGHCPCRLPHPLDRERERVEPWRNINRSLSKDLDDVGRVSRSRFSSLLKLVTNKHRKRRASNCAKTVAVENDRVRDFCSTYIDDDSASSPVRLIMHDANSSHLSADTPQRATRGSVRMRRLDSKANDARFDYTGMFHWCPKRTLSSILLTVEEAAQINFRNHVVVCVFGHADSPLIGLVNFVMPLRASNYNEEELKPIVFIGQLEYLQREWETMNTFTKCFILPGSPLNRANLRAVNLQHCDMCVILSARQKSKSIFDTLVIDKEVILCCLNIKSMRFNDAEEVGLAGSGSFHSSRQSALLIVEKRSRSRPCSTLNLSQDCQPHATTVPTVIELAQESNVQFLDQDDDDDPDVPLYLTQPFQSGNAFTVSLLDSLLTTAFYNKDALSLIRALVTGGSTPELEQILAEGLGFCPAVHATDAIASLRRRPRVTELPITSSTFSHLPISEGITFSTLFLDALEAHNIICLGLYRLPQNSKNGKRYVIVNPPATYPIVMTDRVICLQPFEPYSVHGEMTRSRI